jgi:hypothetical protein
VKQANTTSLPAIFSRIPCEYSGPAKACNLPPLTVIHATLVSRTASDLHIRLAPSTWLKLQTRCSLDDWPVTQMNPLLPSTRQVNPPSSSTGTRPRLKLLNWHALDATIAAPALTIHQVRLVRPRSRPPFQNVSYTASRSFGVTRSALPWSTARAEIISVCSGSSATCSLLSKGPSDRVRQYLLHYCLIKASEAGVRKVQFASSHLVLLQMLSRENIPKSSHINSVPQAPRLSFHILLKRLCGIRTSFPYLPTKRVNESR